MTKEPEKPAKLAKLIEEFGGRHPGEWTEVSWQPPPHLPFERYEVVFEDLRSRREEYEVYRDTLLWWIADAVANGDMVLGQQFSQMLGPVQLVKENLGKLGHLAEQFIKGERWSRSESGVSTWMHWEVRKLGNKDRTRLLGRYSEDPDYSREDLRADVRALLKEHDEEKQAALFDESGADDLVPCPTCGEGHIPKETRDEILGMRQELEYRRAEVQTATGRALSDILSAQNGGGGEDPQLGDAKP